MIYVNSKQEIELIVIEMQNTTNSRVLLDIFRNSEFLVILHTNLNSHCKYGRTSFNGHNLKIRLDALKIWEIILEYPNKIIFFVKQILMQIALKIIVLLYLSN